MAERYTHPEQTSPMRPDVGTQAHFRKKKAPKTYRYDSSLAPSLEWDGQNSSRELGEWLLDAIGRASALKAPHEFDSPQEFETPDGRVVVSVRGLRDAVDHLKRLSKPFLNWTGKAERLSSDEEVLVDRPEVDSKIVRVTGPFAFGATIPTPVDWDEDGVEDSASDDAQSYGSFVDRMIEVLRRSPVLHVGGGKTVQLANVRQPAKSLSLSAEGMSLNGDQKAVAFVFGPEREKGRGGTKKEESAETFQVELVGLDTFDPATMETDHRSGDDVPAWFVDTDYNGLCFHVSQAFFPRTGAWNDLRKALKGDYDESVWDHLAGTTSAPFEAGEHRQVAVKVIDDRGNELLVVKSLG